MRSPFRSALQAALVGGCLAACAPSPALREWSIAFDGASRPGTRFFVEVRASCHAEEPAYAAFEFEQGSPPIQQRFDTASLAIYVEASDATCTTYARGCGMVSGASSSAPTVVTLRAVADSPACRLLACDCGDGGTELDASTDGALRDADAGADAGADASADAGSDAGPMTDAGSGDAGFDAGCESSAETCNAVDDDCDGAIDEAPTCTPCNPVRRGSSTYLFCPSSLTWNGARAYCLARGYELVTIEDAAEDAFVEAQAIATGVGLDYWIGLNDRDGDGVYTWSSGAAETYRHWCCPAAEDKIVGGCAFWTDVGLLTPDEAGWFSTSCLRNAGLVCEAAAPR